jgi:hypothetical protein
MNLKHYRFLLIELRPSFGHLWRQQHVGGNWMFFFATGKLAFIFPSFYFFDARKRYKIYDGILPSRASAEPCKRPELLP